MPFRGQRLAACAGIGLLLAVFASAFVGIRFAVRAYPPGALALLRFGTASIALAAVLIVLRRRLPLPAARDLPGLAASGLFGVTLYHLALNAGERTVTAAVASLVVNTTPIFAAILAALASAIYYVIEKPYLARYPALDVTAWGFWAGTALLVPFAGPLADAVRIAPREATLAGVYLGIVPAAIGYVGWSAVLARMEVARATSLLYLIPPLAAVLGWAILGEGIGLFPALGGATTIAGVALVNGRRRDPAPAGARSGQRRRFARRVHSCGSVTGNLALDRSHDPSPAPRRRPSGRHAVVLRAGGRGAPRARARGLPPPARGRAGR